MLTTTINPDDEDDNDLEIDDDDRVYKNPRNFPNTHCPRDEDKAEFMVSLLESAYKFENRLPIYRLLLVDLPMFGSKCIFLIFKPQISTFPF